MKFRLHPLLLTNIFLGIFSLIVTSAVADNAKKPYWQDVQVVAVNKEYPRSSFMTYDNREDALSGKFERSKFYRLLNGTWKFYFVDSYKDLLTTLLIRASVQTHGMISKFPATGKYKDME